jgi:hypothetical protein
LTVTGIRIEENIRWSQCNDTSSMGHLKGRHTIASCAIDASRTESWWRDHARPAWSQTWIYGGMNGGINHNLRRGKLFCGPRSYNLVRHDGMKFGERVKYVADRSKHQRGRRILSDESQTHLMIGAGKARCEMLGIYSSWWTACCPLSRPHEGPTGSGFHRPTRRCLRNEKR